MRTSIASLALLPLAFLVACGDDGGGAGTLGGDVVGAWRELPNATDDDPPAAVGDRPVWTFGADGSMSLVTPDETETGSYTLDGGDLTLLPAGGGTDDALIVPYRATGDRLVLGAFLPVGDADGMVGTWTARVTSQGEPRDITLTIRADMTTTYAADGVSATAEDYSYDGTWRAIGDDLELLLMPQPNFTLHMRASLVDGVIGSPHEKL